MNIQSLQSSGVYQAPAVRQASDVQAAEDARKASAPSAAPDFDEYIPEDRTGLEHSGFYEPVQGENGPGLRFDAPEDVPVSGKAAPGNSSGSKAEQTTTNTDSVDREIERLRARQEKLAGQLRSASPEDAERIQKRLSQLENELRQKDNDTYRKAHAVIS